MHIGWGVSVEQEEKKMYTIEDIARELGVSKTTVSRAISGKGRIGQKTSACLYMADSDYLAVMYFFQCLFGNGYKHLFPKKLEYFRL